MAKGKLVLGLGISGRAAARLLIREGEIVIAVDQNKEQLTAHPEVVSLIQQGLQLFSENEFNHWETVDAVITSPGIPSTHSLIESAVHRGIDIIGEMELACRRMKGSAIGITGTNGKTTTTLLVSHVLKECGIDAAAVGNVGRAISDSIHDEKTFVVELSSYQLETLQVPCFDFAAFLNLTPDHLDRYKTIESYAAAKWNLIRCLKPNGKLFVSDQVAREFLPPNDPRIQVVREAGAFGFAQILCQEFGIEARDFESAAVSFTPPAHRIEYVTTINGVDYFNDSKATNIESVHFALNKIEGPIYLIAGGQHKGRSYQSIIEYFKGKIAGVAAFGEAGKIIESELSDCIPVCRFDTLSAAVDFAHQRATPGQKVLLSPGCASFDQFQNFEERGNHFKALVKAKE